MSAQDLNILFVIWRESVEALLVIGILNAWLSYRPPLERRMGRMWLWSGAAFGLLGALVFATVLLKIGDALDDEIQEYFQTGVVLLASCLIVQMVFWMRNHGRTLKTELCDSLNQVADRANWVGVFVLSALSVFREGSEVPIFLYGTLVSVSAKDHSAIFAAAFGFLAALATYGGCNWGDESYPGACFSGYGKILLFLASSLLLSGVDHLISLDLLPSLSSRLWDTSTLVPDSGMFGGLVSGLTGYRARPVLSQVLIFIGYWGAILWLLYRPRAVQPA